ncbi:hypothetical protein JG688_00004537 [Phytophthora aleatoria]|uniref:OTU domain-containing protein 1 n=1 Tax=Phytophthora aleatoria TaxID=2496075 RepID=A0A8J5JDX7_9STRA|nr:hypothetical protein JG688_00004537 [Phytophthora aleatoria]
MGRKVVKKLAKKAPKVFFEAATGKRLDDVVSKVKTIKPKKKQKNSSYVVDDDAIKLMRRQLADVGCKLHEVEADGNCLFRALGDQLYGDQHQHEEAREKIVSYLEQHRDDFEPFMEDEEKFEKVAVARKYCERMREDGTWGGNQELYAAARLFQVYVVVHQDQPSARIMVIECDRLKPTRFVHVAYHGEDHYDSVRALRDPMDPDTLPVPIELDYDGFRAQDFAKHYLGSTMTTRLSARFSLRSSSKSSSKRRSHKGVRSWFSFSSKTDNNGADLAADAATAAREVDDELQKTKQRTESGCSYVPRVEYGSPHCDVVERDAPWTSHEQVEQHYTALGWTVVPICKDGNCLFRAISDQLYNNELFHQDIRRRLVEFIEREEKLFQPFVVDEQVGDYCTRMREDGEWGGHLELYAAARLFNIHIVVHTGPVRRLRVTNDDEGDTDKQNPPPPLPYRILHLLFKDDHYSSLHFNEDVKTIAPEEYTVAPTDKRVRSPTKAFDSPDKKSVKVQETKVVSIQDLTKKPNKSYDPSRKNVKFQEVVEAMPPPREGKAFLYQEEDLPECGVLLPKQVLFKRGKRRVSGATLFSLVHVPSTSNLKPVVETTSVSTSSDASTATSSSEGQEDDSETKSPVSGRPKPKAPALRAVPVEFPSKTVFHKGRATAAC